MRGTKYRGINSLVTTFKDGGVRDSEIFTVEKNRFAIENRLIALIQSAAGQMDLACPVFSINIWGVMRFKGNWGGSSICGEYITFYIPFPDGCEVPNSAGTLRLAVRVARASDYDKKTCLAILRHLRETLADYYA